MRILVTGSRAWKSETQVCDALDRHTRHHPGHVIVVHGDCPTGADQFAKHGASHTGAQQEAYPAQWKQHGRAAGPLRDQHMVSLGADLCLAFRPQTPAEPGTASTAPAPPASQSPSSPKHCDHRPPETGTRRPACADPAIGASSIRNPNQPARRSQQPNPAVRGRTGGWRRYQRARKPIPE